MRRCFLENLYCLAYSQTFLFSCIHSSNVCPFSPVTFSTSFCDISSSSFAVRTSRYVMKCANCSGNPIDMYFFTFCSGEILTCLTSRPNALVNFFTIRRGWMSIYLKRTILELQGRCARCVERKRQRSRGS